MKYTILASGSKGNACIVESQGVRLMIDCGTTKKYLTQRFTEIDMIFSDIDALLITHDHTDHTSQIKHFQESTLFSPSTLNWEYQHVIPYESFKFAHFDIFPIKTSHDVQDSVGYIICDGYETLVYITDTGYIRDYDLQFLKGADYYILESNHDPELLMQTRRPYSIKRRILSDTGHLSNEEAGLVLSKIVDANTKEIVLAHMSEEANEVALALSTVQELVDNEHIDFNVAKQFELMFGGN